MSRYAILLFLFSIAGIASYANSRVIQQDTIIVARDGTGDFRNIQEALNSIRAFRPEHTAVYIKKGVYKEKLVLPSWVTGVTLTGEDRDQTVINYDDHANIDNMGTFRSYTFLIQGNDITLENLTIENSAPQLGQAVAVHIEGDKVVFRNCRLLGNQDTVYAGKENCRQYFENCYIEGTTDFIFGPAVSWFEGCTIHCKRNSYITAASTPENQKYGYVFNNCTVTIAGGVTKVYLGRPWRAYGMTLFMNTYLPEGIAPAGWDNWRKEENERTARYMEYNNAGPGAATSRRVGWSKVLTEEEASAYTLPEVMKGTDNWDPSGKSKTVKGKDDRESLF